MFGKARTGIGLDIGTFSIKAVRLSFSGSHVTVTDFGYEEIPSEEGRAEALGRLVQTCHLKGADVVTSVSGRSVIVRYVNLRKMDDEELRNAIKFEADKYIPFGVDEVVLDCQRLETTEGISSDEMRVLLVAVKRNVVEDHVAMVRSAGLNPIIVDVDVFALGNSYLASSQAADDEVVALVDVGAAKTNINVLEGQNSLFTREVYVAGGDFSAGIARRLSINPFEVEQLKREPQGRQEEIHEAVASCTDDLGKEVRLSLDFFENEFDKTVKTVKLSGGGALLEGLAGQLEQSFGKSTQLWSPAESLPVSIAHGSEEDFKRSGSQVAVAVGLAARMGRK